MPNVEMKKKAHRRKYKTAPISFRPDADVFSILAKLPVHMNRSALLNRCIREKLPSIVFVTK